MAKDTRTRRQKWLDTMVAIHGSEEAVTAFMAEAAKKATKTGTGGFHYLAKHDPEKHREASKLGGERGRRSKDDKRS